MVIDMLRIMSSSSSKMAAAVSTSLDKSLYMLLLTLQQLFVA